MRNREEGQVLALFAIILTLLIGMSALVVDVGMKYSSERAYQSLADAAALAGAQELQPTSRSVPVSNDMREQARKEALRVVLSHLVGTPTDAACAPTSNINCTVGGGRYRVVIQTPAPTCQDCDPDRAIQVRVEEPNYSTSFARVFGQTTWNLNRTSVAGLSYGKSLTIVTLRPPQPNGKSTGFDVRDFRIEGGSNVQVSTGDVGTNANMEYGGTNSVLSLDSGYSMFYYDPYNGPTWVYTAGGVPNPPGKKLSTMIPDPGYVIPAAPTTNPGSVVTLEDPGTACHTAATNLLTGTGSTYAPYIPVDTKATTPAPDMKQITCLLPGYFSTDPTKGALGSDTVILLKNPAGQGLFFFGAGLTVGSSLIGGYEPNAPGVAIVIPDSQELNVNTQGKGVTAVSLNAGSKFLNPAGAEASPALDFSNKPIVTSGTPAVKMTLMVTRDGNCKVVEPYPTACADLSNDAIKIAGDSNLYLAGVQFMPTDNSSISSSASTGYVGQIWAWTLKYSGGVTIRQEGSSGMGAGVMRLDTACSPGEPCNP